MTKFLLRESSNLDSNSQSRDSCFSSCSAITICYTHLPWRIMLKCQIQLHHTLVVSYKTLVYTLSIVLWLVASQNKGNPSIRAFLKCHQHPHAAEKGTVLCSFMPFIMKLLIFLQSVAMKWQVQTSGSVFLTPITVMKLWIWQLQYLYSICFLCM